MSDTHEVPQPRGAQVRQSRWSRSPLVKACFVFVIALVLLIPLGWVRGLIGERRDRASTAYNEISSVWGAEQTIAGPFLSIPVRVTTVDERTGVARESVVMTRVLPERLTVAGTLTPERRSYGIFGVIVYQASLQISGSFADPGLLKLPEGEVLWDQTILSLGVSDPRGITRELRLDWQGREVAFAPGAQAQGLRLGGVHAEIADPRPREGAEAAQFSFPLTLNGTRLFQVLPFGKHTEVTLASSWSSPSFCGAYLPSSRAVSDNGFEAEWQVPYFGRSYPQSWQEQEEATEIKGRIHASAFGVELLVPVDLYRKTTRSVKYGLLFVGLSFLAFYLVELRYPVRVHPFQYLMVGAALCLFYLLLLSLAEHLGFGIAYLVSTGAVVLMISGYSRSVLAGGGRAGVMAAVLSGLFGFLWILLVGEDYALLAGSLGLFVILGVVMYLTRRLDWYELDA